MSGNYTQNSSGLRQELSAVPVAQIVVTEATFGHFSATRLSFGQVHSVFVKYTLKFGNYTQAKVDSVEFVCIFICFSNRNIFFILSSGVISFDCQQVLLDVIVFQSSPIDYELTSIRIERSGISYWCIDFH